MVIVLVSVAAWLPSLQPYVAVGEDYARHHVPELSLAAYQGWWVRHWATEGPWRIIGLPLVEMFRGVHPLGFPLASLAFHTINGVLVAIVLQRLRVGLNLATLGGVYFVTLPAAVEANLYAAAAPSLLTTTIFLLVAAHLAAATTLAAVSYRALAACFVAAFAASAVQENLLFAYLLLPIAIGHVQQPISAWTASMTALVLRYVMTIGAGSVAHAMITLATREAPTKATGLNLETVVAFAAYQYTNLLAFGLWSHRSLLALIAGNASLWLALTSVLLLAAAAIWSWPLRAGAEPADSHNATSATRRRLVEAMLGLWFAAGAIYVLTGGYSFESRKKYVTLFFLASIVAAAASWFIDAARSRRARDRRVALVMASVAFCAATTWAISGLWILELRRGDALVQAIVARPELRELRVRFVPDVTAIWPQWRALASSQHSSGWVTEYELSRRYERTVAVGSSAAPVIECRAAVARQPPRCEAAPEADPPR